MRYLLRIVCLLSLLSLSACGRQEKRYPLTLTPYQVVVSHLAETTARRGTFSGSKVLVASEPCTDLSEEDHLYLAFPVDEALRKSLFEENSDSRGLELAQIASSNSKIGIIDSFSYPLLDEKPEPHDYCCMVQFWLAGYSQDGKTAIVYFRYGPGSHGGGIGTYIIRKTADGWTVEDSEILLFA